MKLISLFSGCGDLIWVSKELALKFLLLMSLTRLFGIHLRQIILKQNSLREIFVKLRKKIFPTK